MICFPEILKTETDKIKKILAGNGYPLKLINRVIKSHDDNRKKPKLFGPEKFPAVLKLPYFGNASRLFERNVQELVQTTYN